MLIVKLTKDIKMDHFNVNINVSANAFLGGSPDFKQTSFSLLQYLKLKTYKYIFFF